MHPALGRNLSCGSQCNAALSDLEGVHLACCPKLVPVHVLGSMWLLQSLPLNSETWGSCAGAQGPMTAPHTASLSKESSTSPPAVRRNGRMEGPGMA